MRIAVNLSFSFVEIQMNQNFELAFRFLIYAKTNVFSKKFLRITKKLFFSFIAIRDLCIALIAFV